MSVLAEVATTPTSGSPWPLATIQNSGTRMAPQMITPSATSTPRFPRDLAARTARAASAYAQAADRPHSRCSESVLNSETPPANRAEPASPAVSQTQGRVVTECQPLRMDVLAPPPTPVVGASTRVSRLSTRHILRPARWLARSRAGGPLGGLAVQMTGGRPALVI